MLNDRVPPNALPSAPSFHKALDDPGMITMLKNAARKIGYVIR